MPRAATTVREHARVVIGADGRHSLVAKATQPDTYNARPPLLASYYSYWSGVPMDGRFEIYIRPNRGFAAVPTHHDRTLVIAGWPYAEFEANKKDVEGTFPRDPSTCAIVCRPAFAAASARSHLRARRFPISSASHTDRGGYW